MAADSIDGLRLNRAFKAGILRLLSRQEHLNKINVFPVPDGDTGTNLALTMSAVLGTLQRFPDSHAGKTLTRVADAALDGARGNSGAILAQFFLGVCDKLGHLGDLSAADFADGVHGGAAYARESLSEPREGTIITVLSDFAHELNRVRREGVRDLRALLRRGVTVAEQSLAGTTQQLEALRKANVVDAGGQGFVEFISGVTDYIESGTEDEPAVPMPAVIDAASETTAGLEEDLEYRYCTECVVIGESRGPASPARGTLRDRRQPRRGRAAAQGARAHPRQRSGRGVPDREPLRDGLRREGRRHAAPAARGPRRRTQGGRRDRLGRGHPGRRDGPSRHPHGAAQGALRRPGLPRPRRHHPGRVLRRARAQPAPPEDVAAAARETSVASSSSSPRITRP